MKAGGRADWRLEGRIEAVVTIGEAGSGMGELEGSMGWEEGDGREEEEDGVVVVVVDTPVGQEDRNWKLRPCLNLTKQPAQSPECPSRPCPV